MVPRRDEIPTRSIAALQARQATGDLQVLTAADYRALVARVGLAQAARQTDVVVAADTLLTDQGALLLALGPCDPPIRLREVQIGGVAAQVAGSSSELLLPLGCSPTDAARRSGGHVLAELLAGGTVSLSGLGEPTALQPRLELSGAVGLPQCGVARLLLHRAIVENGIVAVSTADGLLRTPYGPLLGPLASALYSCGGAGSIGLTMPGLSLLGPGSPVLVGGGIGWVQGAGSGHNPSARRQPSGHATVPGVCAAVAVDVEQLSTGAVRPCFVEGHGAALLIAIAAPVPLLDATVAAQAAAQPEDLQAPVLDLAVPRRIKPQLAAVTYGQLARGQLTLQGTAVRCAPAHSPRLAAAAAQQLCERLRSGAFPLLQPAMALSRRPGLVPLDP